MAAKDSPAPSYIISLFSRIAEFDFHHPRLIVLVSVITCLISLLYTAKYLKFDADQANLIKRAAAVQAGQERYNREFPKAEDMVVIVEDGTARQRQAFVDELAQILRSEPETFSDVFEKVDVTFLRRYALHYLQPEQLRDIAGDLESYKSYLITFAGSRGLIDLMQKMPKLVMKSNSTKKDGKKQVQEPDIDNIGSALPTVESFLDMFILSMETRGRFSYVSPWTEALIGNFDQAEDADESITDVMSHESMVQYNTVGQGRFYTLLCRPTYRAGESADVSVTRAVTRLREILAKLELSHRDVIVGLTGELVLNVDEAEASTNDSIRSAILSLVLIAAVFIWAFREVVKPLKAVVTLVIGVGWTMGFTTLVIGHLNLLTVTCATILMGLGIDFGIHALYRYDEECVRNGNVLEAGKAVLCGACYENFTGAMSTALAFLVLIFTDFTGIAELGLIAGSGIILCYLAMMFVLPSLLFMPYSKAEDPLNGKAAHEAKAIGQFAFLASIEKWLLARSGLVVTAGIVLTVVSVVYSTRVHYDYNLLNLQAKGLQSVNTEMHLIKSSDHSLLCGISLAKDIPEAGRRVEEFSKLPTVASVDSVAMIIPSRYGDKAAYLKRIVGVASDIPVPKGIVRDNEVSRIAMFRSLGDSIGQDQNMIDDVLGKLSKSQDPNVRKSAQRISLKLDKLFKTMSNMGPGAIENGLTAFEDHFYKSLGEVINLLHMQVEAPPLDIKDLPDGLRNREIGRNGAIQIRIFPKGNVWERPAQERFVKDMQSVDPDVVGMPVMSYYDCQELRVSNEKAGMWALIAVWILLFVHFRKIGVALLALMPKVIGIVWMAGVMGYLGVNFNSANFLALPLILGIGLVFGLHIINRVAEEGETGIFSHSTGPSITLSALTTMIGFASMISAQHQGVASLGLVMTVGVGCNLLSSAVFLPAVLNVLRDRFGYSVRLK